MQSARVDDTLTVSFQIQPEDVAAIRDAGFVAIINNRPDGEAPDQPDGAEIARAAAEAGLAYTALPVTGREGITPDTIRAFHEALETAGGPVFAFCRTGTRSINLWALSQAGDRDVADLVRMAGDAGYDLSGLAPALRQIADHGLPG